VQSPLALRGHGDGDGPQRLSKSLRQIAAALNARGIATARGGKWEATTVANILKRVAA
jgi:Recombinase